MPNIGAEDELGVAVGRRVVVGQHHAHLVQVAENGLAGSQCFLNAYNRLAPLPDFVLSRQTDGILAADDIGKRRFEWVRTVGLALAANGVELFPFLEQSGIASLQFL